MLIVNKQRKNYTTVSCDGRSFSVNCFMTISKT
uniref:Uncharacterized protein n=1 Tax=Megaselia scalaris TaxID=36166 RepID=T1GPG9_MEGSC